MQELIKASAIENQLTGTVKLANEEKHTEYGVQDDVKLMSNPPHAAKAAARPGAVHRARPREPRWRPSRRSGCRRKSSREFERDQSAEADAGRAG